MLQLKTVTVLQESSKVLHMYKSFSDCLNWKGLASDVFNVLLFSVLEAFYTVVAFRLIS